MKKLINSLLSSKNIPHLFVLLLFLVFSITFFYPTLSGKKIVQSDIVQYSGMARQLKEHRKDFNEETYWIDNAFGGMPTYQLGARYPADFLTPIHSVFKLIPRPAEILFLYLLFSYIFFIIIKLPWRIALFGAFAYGLSTYLLIILQVGHNTKAQALAYMPLVIGGVYLIFNEKRGLGFFVSVLALALQIRANHYQITYYMLILIAIMIIVFFYHAYGKKNIRSFSLNIGILISSIIISLGFNSTPLLSTAEYSKFSTRGESELKLNPDGNIKEPSSGLDREYITQFSYGIFESLNLIIPRIQGGGSTENLGTNSSIYNFLIREGVSVKQSKQFVKNVPTYWGKQPILEAPAYIGITVFFIAVLALFFIKRTPLINSLILGSILSLMLSWGKNFSFLTNLFIDYFPLYNKFRAVSSIQIILEFCIPALAAIGLYHFFKQKNSNKLLVKIFLGFTSMLFLIFVLKDTYSFSSPFDAYFQNNYGSVFMEQILIARKEIFQDDIFRALIYITIVTIILFLYNSEKINKNIGIGLISVIMIFDLISISSRYIDRKLFLNPGQVDKVFKTELADKAILQDTSYYRVFEPRIGLSGSRTSFFHNSIGGYHGAKPRRYEELFAYSNKHEISGVIDMLNVKYLLYKENGILKSEENKNALGNAWSLDSVIIVKTPDMALQKMKTIDFNTSAVAIEEEFPKGVKLNLKKDSLFSIKLNKISPQLLKYEYRSNHDQLVVFSEMYYPKGWNVTLNQKNVNHFPINYILRGMFVPKGEHEITFSFTPDKLMLGTLIRWISLFLFLIITVLIILKAEKIFSIKKT